MRSFLPVVRLSLCILAFAAAAALPAQSQRAEIVPIVGHSRPVGAVALSADNKLAVSFSRGWGESSENELKVWSAESGRLIRTIKHPKLGQRVSFFLDGKRVLSGWSIFDLATGHVVRSFTDNVEGSELDRLSPDGRFFATVSDRKVLTLWSTADGSRLQRIDTSAGRKRLGKSEFYSLADFVFSRDGTLLLTGGSTGPTHVDWAKVRKPPNSGVLRLWNVNTGELLQEFDLPKAPSSPDGYNGRVGKVAISPNSRTAVAHDAEGLLTFWDLNAPRLLAKTVTDSYELIGFLDDFHLLAQNSDSLATWDVTTGRTAAVLKIAATEVALSHDSRYVLGANDANKNDYSLVLLDRNSGKVVRRFGKANAVPALVVSAAGAVVHSVNDAGSLATWDTGSGALQQFTEFNVPLRSLASSKDGRLIAVGASGGVIKLVDADGRVLHSFSAHRAGVRSIASSDDGRLLASAGGDNLLKIWDTQTRKLVRSVGELNDPTVQSADGYISQVHSVAGNPKFDRVVAGHANGSIQFLDVRTGRSRYADHDDTAGITAAGVTALDISPQGDLITGNLRGTLKLWRAARGSKVQTLGSPDDLGAILAVSFSPDGRWIASGDGDELKIWESASGRLVRSLTGHSGAIRAARILPGNRVVVSAGDDGTIRYWEFDSGKVLATSISAADGEWLTITPEGFFDASANGTSLLSVVRGLDVYSVDQFYQSLYRPDLLREKLAGDPRGKVRGAAAVLDLDKIIESGSAPGVRVSTPGLAAGGGAIDAAQLEVEAELSDRGGGIGRVEWRVNGITAFVDNPSPPPPGQPARLTHTLGLDPGNNDISVVAYNSSNLIVSSPSRIGVTRARPAAPVASPSAEAAPKPRLFAIVVGVNDYADRRFLLANAVSDAREVMRGLNEAAGGLYHSIEMKLLTDAEANREGLNAAFRDLASRAQTSDLFVLYLAGHGKTVDGRYYFIPQNFTVDGQLSEASIAASVRAKAITQAELQRWFASVPARRGVIMFDTCDSGTLTGDAGITQQLERGAANERLGQATGRSIIAASSGSQEALEGYRGHGLFTYQMLVALDRADSDGNGTIEVAELAAYVRATVGELSLKEFRRRQEPQMTITANYALARRTRVLPDDSIPVAEAGPKFRLQQTAQLQVQPGPGATVVRSISPTKPVTVLENRNGWALIASEGKPLGYVAARHLTPLQ